MSGGLRKRRAGYFVQVPRQTARDKRLSFRARGVLVFLLDQPEGWDVRSEWIADQGKEGRDAVRTALGELREHGYYRLERQRLLDGSIAMGTAVSETPVATWVEQSKEYGGLAVLVVQQPDETFLVVRKDGSTEADGFDRDVDYGPVTSDDDEPLTVGEDPSEGDGADAPTGDGFSGAGTGDGKSGAGKPVAGFPGPLRETEKGEATRTPSSPPAAAAAEARSVTADAATDGALALDQDQENDPAPAALSLVAEPEPTPDPFEAFWTAYPRKVAKADAATKFRRACRGTDPEVIVAAAVALAADPNLPGGPNDPRGKEGRQFVPHPSTWLSQRRWEDEEPLPPLPTRQATGRQAFTNAALGWDTTPAAAVTSPLTDDELQAKFGAPDPGVPEWEPDPHDQREQTWNRLLDADVVECAATSADGFDLDALEDRAAAQIVARWVRGAAAKESPVNLLVQGPTRVGKTATAIGAARMARAMGLSVRIVKHADYVAAHRPDAVIPNGLSLQSYEKRYADVDVLVVDDLGASAGVGDKAASEFAGAQTMRLIGDRATSGKHTIVTTNLTYHPIVNVYGEQLAHRLSTDMVNVRMQGGPRGGVATDW